MNQQTKHKILLVIWIFIYITMVQASPTNSAIDARTVMQTSGLVYTWDSQKLMTNTAFAIVHLKYNADRALTALQSTRFQVTNARKAPGDCFLDYFTSTRYGAAIPVANINTASLTALNTYSNASFTYTLIIQAEHQHKLAFNLMAN
jgi:hypothetical protein